MDKIIVEAVITLAVCLAWYAWQRYVKPWLTEHRLYEAAEIAVQSAEAIYGRYHGKDKLQEALNQLKAIGFDIEADDVLNAVRAAWQRLNTSQIAAGEKTISIN